MQTSQQKKVLLIGWDAADWNVINPLLDSGQMPNLAAFVDQGVIGNLATLQPVLSPILWTSIATGKRPYKHGICGFVEPDPQNGGIRPITNLSRNTKAIWNILQQNGFKSNVVGWWPSHPAEPISGVMVSNHFQKADGGLDQPWPIKPGSVHPERLAQQLKPYRIHPLELEAEHLLPFVPQAAEIDQANDPRLFAIAKMLSDCSTIHAAATATMQLEPWDFMAVYYDAIDHFCHGFMKYHPPRQDQINERDFELYHDVVNSAYRYHDMMLGTLLKLAGEDTTVILMSDHGFHSNHLRPAALPNEPAGPAAEHRQFGIFAIKGPNVHQDQRIYGASLLDITPTILHSFGLPAGKDMDGKVLTQCFRDEALVERIRSWEAVKGDSGQHPANKQLDPIESHEAIRQLVELGYIDESDEDATSAANDAVRELEYNLARACVDGRRFDQAIRLFQSLWERWPEEQRFGVRLLNCHLALNQVAQARKTIDLIIQRKRRFAEVARQDLSELKKQLETKQETEITSADRQRIKRLRAKSTTNQPAICYLNACVSHAEGDHQKALQLLSNAAHAQQSHLPSVLFKQGEIHLELRDWTKAHQSFQSLVESDPSNPHGHLGLCRVYLARRKAQLAAQHAATSIGLVFHNPFAHFLYAICLRRIGQMDLAIKAMETAVAQSPGFKAAHRRLAGWHRQFFDDHVKADHHLSQIQRLKSKRLETTCGDPDERSLDGQALNQGPAVSRPLPVVDWDNRDVITVVSGLPRSGTSMMMQMLKAGGVKILTDHIRQADQNNQRGYLEFEPVKSMHHQSPVWLEDASGRVVKIIAPLLPYLKPEHRYRIILMQRDLDEVVASQQNMLSRLGRRGANLDEVTMKATQQRHLREALTATNRLPNVQWLNVHYQHALEYPEQVAKQVVAFLGDDRLDTRAMADTIDRSLYRERNGQPKGALC